MQHNLAPTRHVWHDDLENALRLGRLDTSRRFSGVGREYLVLVLDRGVKNLLVQDLSAPVADLDPVSRAAALEESSIVGWSEHRHALLHDDADRIAFVLECQAPGGRQRIRFGHSSVRGWGDVPIVVHHD